MILLDTDHISVLAFPESLPYVTLHGRLASAADPRIATTIITAAEQMRGWLARINRLADVHRQVSAYDELADLFLFFQRWEVVRFDRAAADFYLQLRKDKVRIGTNDLKIAAIALSRGALLLSANLRDYRKVPGLRVEDWLQS
jgi:tRNA(fMet)-specific endonuclease VapC